MLGGAAGLRPNPTPSPRPRRRGTRALLLPEVTPPEVPAPRGGLSGTALPWPGAVTPPAPRAPRGGQSPRTPRAASLPGTAKSSRSSWAPTRSRSRSPTNACTGCALRSPTPAATSTTTRTTSSSSRWARGRQDPLRDPPPSPPHTAPLLQIPLPHGIPRGHGPRWEETLEARLGLLGAPCPSFPIPWDCPSVTHKRPLGCVRTTPSSPGSSWLQLRLRPGGCGWRSPEHGRGRRSPGIRAGLPCPAGSRAVGAPR